MVTRIIVVLLVSLVHSSLGLAQGQQPKKVARIGYLSLGFPPPLPPPRQRNIEAFHQGLREEGYSEGKNLIIEYRYSKGKSGRFAGLATELVSSKVDLIVAPTTPAIQAARQATTKIPIVMLSVGDPTEGIVDSLARPGGNITGVTGDVPALSGKLLGVLIDAVPKVNRVGVLWYPPTTKASFTEMEKTARALRVPIKNPGGSKSGRF